MLVPAVMVTWHVVLLPNPWQAPPQPLNWPPLGVAVSVGVSCVDVCLLQESDEQLIGPPSDTDPDPVMVTVSTVSPAPLS
jgi:hypothetical protein